MSSPAEMKMQLSVDARMDCRHPGSQDAPYQPGFQHLMLE
jgi:hypothetical protein